MATTYVHHLVTQPLPYITHVQINRPEKLNAYFEPMWLELGIIFRTLSTDPEVRAIVLSGAGDKAFTAGLDVEAASSNGGVLGGGNSPLDTARKAAFLRRHIEEFQDCVSAIEKCEKPVICVLHGYSLGLAIDMSTCADIRLCAKDTKFAVKEVDIGLAADVGTLSRLPKVVGNLSWVKDVALSARIFGAEEALRVGFVSQVLDTKEQAVVAGLNMAQLIASKSPVAVQGTKELLNHARDHSVAQSLRYTAIWNQAMLQTDDLSQALLSGLKKTKPTFSKL
ncbi:ClpP/crotonase-like domain-containing protein [Xylogone sp. PMI_703]|nr:ClpP/crotonase-like domain-containing protein [Xylogone sp. PMI_703]